MEFSYCRRCGDPLRHTDGHELTCGKHTIYANCSPASAIALTMEDKLLVAVRAIEPFKGAYDITGGFNDGRENSETAARREIQEETGLERNDYGQLDYLGSAVDDYPYQNEVVNALTTVFTAEILHLEKIKASSDIESLEFVEISGLDENNFPGASSKLAVKLIKQKFGNTSKK